MQSQYPVEDRKSFGPTKYPREEISGPQNIHEEKFQDHKIPTRKHFGRMEYPREKISDPRIHDGTMA